MLGAGSSLSCSHLHTAGRRHPRDKEGRGGEGSGAGWRPLSRRLPRQHQESWPGPLPLAGPRLPASVTPAGGGAEEGVGCGRGRPHWCGSASWARAMASYPSGPGKPKAKYPFKKRTGQQAASAVAGECMHPGPGTGPAPPLVPSQGGLFCTLRALVLLVLRPNDSWLGRWCGEGGGVEGDGFLCQGCCPL